MLTDGKSENIITTRHDTTRHDTDSSVPTRITAIFCAAILVIFFTGIAVRVITRQVLIKCLHWDNAFTRAVFFDNAEAAGEENRFDWEPIYPFSENIKPQNIYGIKQKSISILDRYSHKITGVIQKISYYATDLLPCGGCMKQAAFAYNDAIGFEGMHRVINANERVLFMKNGYIAFEHAEKPDLDAIEDIAAGMKDFSDYLASMNIEFIYMNAGSKVCPIDKQLNLKDQQLEFTNEKGDALIEALGRYGITAVDFRKEILSSGKDWYDMQYITDDHWRNTTAFWAAGKIAELLNEKYGFEFDLNKFNESSYEVACYENYFLGNLGRIAGLGKCEIEDFDLIMPKYDTNFRLTIPEKSIDISGPYSEALFDMDAFRAIERFTKQDHIQERDALQCVRAANESLAKIHNLSAESNLGKKILVLMDSYSWHLNPILACGIEYIDTIYTGLFNGSIREYVKQNAPDIVIMILCERNISPIDYSTHTSMFDLR